MTTCTSYLPGHNAHWIQARRATTGTPVILRDPDHERFTVVLPDGSQQRWWHHDVERVTQACAIGDALLCRPGPLLKVRDGDTVLPLYPSLPPVPAASAETGSPCHIG